MYVPIPVEFLFDYLTAPTLQIRRNVYAPLDRRLDVECTSMVARKVSYSSESLIKRI
jgi:hypothetical protein